MVRAIAIATACVLLFASAAAIDTRGALRSTSLVVADPRGYDASADSHHDFGDYQGSAASIQQMKDSNQLSFTFDASKTLTETKMELLQLLESFRSEMKTHFVTLEKAIHDKINGIFKIACKGADGESDECWVAMKVECQLFDVQTYVHHHRCQLVDFIKGKLVQIVNDFDAHLTEKNIDATQCPAYDNSANCADSTTSFQCKCNVKMEIDGILGMFLQKGDDHAISMQGPEVTSTCKVDRDAEGHDLLAVWNMDRQQQCPALHDCVSQAPDCSGAAAATDAKVQTYCGDVIRDDDHECLSKHPAFNKDDTDCVRQHLGLLGLTNYYGGNCGSGAGGHKGRVGRLVDSAFECAIEALDENKVSCSHADRAAHHDKCVESSCDCACICGSHVTTETTSTCSGWVGGEPSECDSNTCGSSTWQAQNKCPISAAVAAMSSADCTATATPTFLR